MKIIKPSKEDIDKYREQYGLELKEIRMSDDEQFELMMNLYLPQLEEKK